MADQSDPGLPPAHVPQQQLIDQDNKKLYLSEIAKTCLELYKEAEQIMKQVNDWKEETDSDTAQLTARQRDELICQLKLMLLKAQGFQEELSNSGVGATLPSDTDEQVGVNGHVLGELSEQLVFPTSEPALSGNLGVEETDESSPERHVSGEVSEQLVLPTSEPVPFGNFGVDETDESGGLDAVQVSNDDSPSSPASEDNVVPTPERPSSTAAAAQDFGETGQQQDSIPDESEDQSADNRITFDGTDEQDEATNSYVSDEVTDQLVPLTNEPASSKVEETEKTHDLVDDNTPTDHNLSTSTSESNVFKVSKTPSARTAAKGKVASKKPEITTGSKAQNTSDGEGFRCVQNRIRQCEHFVQKEKHFDESEKATLKNFVMTKDSIGINFTFLFHAMEDISAGKLDLETASFPKTIKDFINEISEFDVEYYERFDPFDFAKRQQKKSGEKYGDNVLIYLVLEEYLKAKKFVKCTKDLLYYISDGNRHESKRPGIPYTAAFHTAVHHLGGYEKRLYDEINTWKTNCWKISISKYIGHQELRHKWEEPTGDRPSFEWKKDFSDYKKSTFFKKRAQFYDSLRKLKTSERIECYDSLPENQNKSDTGTSLTDPKLTHLVRMAEAYEMLVNGSESQVLNSDFDYLSHVLPKKREEYEFAAFTAIFSTTVEGRLLF